MAFEARQADASAFDCIECSACTRACPSGIDLVGEFRALKDRTSRERETAERALAARRHSEARNDRLAREVEEHEARRAERLRTTHQWR